MSTSFIQNQVTMYDHLPCTHPARSGIWKKIPFFGFKKHIQPYAGSGSKHNSNGESVAKIT